MQALETIRQSLLAELEPIDQRVLELKSELDELSRSKAQLKAALKALEPKKFKDVKAAKKTKPSPKQKDVREIATALVQENYGIDKADLEALVKQKLTGELGFDLKGFEMRWKEVLNNGTFVIAADDSVSIAVGEASDSSIKALSMVSESSQLPVER